MGTIINSKIRDDGKVAFEVVLDYDEALQLKGFMDNVHLFTENINGPGSQISGRGKNEATKYFLIPRELRKGLELKSNTKVNCQKIDTATRTIFLYIIDKTGFA